MRISKNNIFWIYLSLVISLFIDLYLFSGSVTSWKPLFTLLFLIYWNMALPNKVGIIEAVFFGLILDLSTGTVLGMHALMFVLITYVCQRFFYQFRVSPLWQQAAILFFLFFIFKQVFAFDLFSSQTEISLTDLSYIYTSFLFAIVSALAWPPIFFILRWYRRKKIRS